MKVNVMIIKQQKPSMEVMIRKIIGKYLQIKLLMKRGGSFSS